MEMEKDQCETYLSLRLTHASAYLSRDYDRAHAYTKKMQDHERSCRLCQSIEHGTGLSGSLFPGAMIVNHELVKE